MSKCLVIPTDSLENLDFWPSLPRVSIGRGETVTCAAKRLGEGEIQALLQLIEKEGEFMERNGDNGVESNPNRQQIICYGLLTRKDEFFVYQRGGENSKYKEERLRNKISAGVGGHIEPYDDSLIGSLRREMDEELTFLWQDGRKIEKLTTEVAELRILGLIIDRRDEVGKVHLGLVCNVILNPNVEVAIKEKGGENIKGWMVTLAEYQKMVSSGEFEPEGWTQLMIESIVPTLLEGPRPGKERK